MDLDLITQPREEAQAELDTYREALREQRRGRNRAEDLRIMAGLTAIAAGRPLRWIGGDLWAVIATWDLTELERAVIAART